MNYDIIATGSKGNATVIDTKILIDCGVPFKKLNRHYKNLSIVLLTHIHSDHFNKATIKKLAFERPLIRFGCGKHLVQALIDCKVPKRNIDVLEPNHTYEYGTFTICPVSLIHNVENIGYKITLGNEKMLYATDTNEISHISAKNFDYYFIEAKYPDDEIRERIEKKNISGEYAYEYGVLNNHLSNEKCDTWLLENIGDNSHVIYMHQHGG